MKHTKLLGVASVSCLMKIIIDGLSTFYSLKQKGEYMYIHVCVCTLCMYFCYTEMKKNSSFTSFTSSKDAYDEESRLSKEKRRLAECTG